MTTLNSRLQLALLKSKKSKNLLQKGFTLKDRLLRPSLVGVSKKGENKDKKDEENKDNLDDK